MSLNQMKEPHHQRTVGYSMIAVAASLAVIGLLQLAIGEDVLYADDIQRKKTQEWEECKKTNFVGEECEKFVERLEIDSGTPIFARIEGGIKSSSP